MTTVEITWRFSHREMLEHVVRGRIYTWAGEPLMRNVEEARARFDAEHRYAYRDLQVAGFVCGEYLTAEGRQQAADWGLNPEGLVR